MPDAFISPQLAPGVTYKSVSASSGGAPFYEYSNDSGRFTVSGSSGMAKYRWVDGTTYTDQLEWLGRIRVSEPDDDLAGVGFDSGWLYKVKNENWWFLFSDIPFDHPGIPGTQIRFRLYTSEDRNTFYRWKTQSGTSRKTLTPPPGTTIGLPPANGLFPRYLPRALSQFATQHALPTNWAPTVLGNMESAALAVQERVKGMSSAEKQQTIQLITTPGGLGLLPGVGVSSFDGIRNPFPIPSNPLPPIEFPPFPDIQIPDLPGVNAATLSDKIQDKVTGFVGGVLQTIKDLITQFPLEIVRVLDRFIDRITTAGELVKSGKVDQAIARLVESVVLLARDVVAAVLATIVNLVVDVVAGIIGGLLLARALTTAERDFAHSIFHGNINVTLLRIAILKGSTGLTSANVIYMPSLDLNDADDRSLFAHELTHVYQDQTVFEPATLHAAHEFLNHYLGTGRDPYKVTLSADSTWSGLGVEQQATVVDRWQERIDRLASLPGAVDRIPTLEVPFYNALLRGEGLF